jgi:predicted nucleic acid-binding protein
MPDDERKSLVVDASVAAKLWFDEGDAVAAEAILRTGRRLIAPAIVHAEIASIASKRVRRGLSPNEDAYQALAQSKLLFDEAFPIIDFMDRAFELARDHGVSAYDGLYLALAEKEGASVLTADEKLIQRARAAGLGALVRGLAPVGTQPEDG